MGKIVDKAQRTHKNVVGTESRNIQQTQVCLGFRKYYTCVLWVANIENPHCFGEFYPFDEDGIESEVAFGQRS